VVDKSQLLAELSDIDIDVSIAELTGQRETYIAQLASLHSLSYDQPGTAARIAEAEAGLKDAEAQLAKREVDRQKLKLVAPAGGTVLPPTLVPKQTQAESQLPTWSGSPLEPENLGATLMSGTKFCQIGDPRRLEARLVIDQGDVELVAPGQRVEVMLTQSADFVYVSEIEKVAPEDLKNSPVHLSSLHGGDLPTKMDDSGVPRPMNLVFEAVVPLPEDTKGLLRIGLVGRAKITTAPRTLGSRLYRYISRTFNFEL
jgi:putative peptide zinc metalloprotease protein